LITYRLIKISPVHRYL